jgi:hypothetical protein
MKSAATTAATPVTTPIQNVWAMARLIALLKA